MSSIVLMPCENEVKTAKFMVNIDLRINIFQAYELLKAGSDLFESDWLARYGLILTNEFQARGKKLIIAKRSFMDYLSVGDSKPPRWMKRYAQAHRVHLVTLGWIRYLVDRGFTQDVAIESIQDSRFKELDGEPRDYAEHNITPRIMELHP